MTIRPFEQATARLHARLITAAAAEGILDVAYRVLDTPVGSLLLAATEQGLVRVAYPGQSHDAAPAQPRAWRGDQPVPIVVPCHRVIRSDGTLGGYAGGPEAKRALLTLEAAV